LEAARNKRDDWEVRRALLTAIHFQQRAMMDDGVASERILLFDIDAGSEILDRIYEIVRRRISRIDKKRGLFEDE
jgi:hypothetical protein